MAEELEGLLEGRAEAQLGLFTLDQALAVGMNRNTLYRRVRLGRYTLEYPGVTIHRLADLRVDQTTGMGRLLKMAKLPPAMFHYVVSTPAGLFLAEVDFAYPEIKLAIEVDGFDAHGTPRAMAKDFVRQNGLVPYGWHGLRFTRRQVTREPDMVAAAIRRTLKALQAA